MALGGHVFESYLVVLGKDHLLSLPSVCVWPYVIIIALSRYFMTIME